MLVLNPGTFFTYSPSFAYCQRNVGKLDADIWAHRPCRNLSRQLLLHIGVLQGQWLLRRDSSA